MYKRHLKNALNVWRKNFKWNFPSTPFHSHLHFIEMLMWKLHALILKEGDWTVWEAFPIAQQEIILKDFVRTIQNISFQVCEAGRMFWFHFSYLLWGTKGNRWLENVRMVHKSNSNVLSSAFTTCTLNFQKKFQAHLFIYS